MNKINSNHMNCEYTVFFFSLSCIIVPILEYTNLCNPKCNCTDLSCKRLKWVDLNLFTSNKYANSLTNNNNNNNNANSIINHIYTQNIWTRIYAFLWNSYNICE